MLEIKITGLQNKGFSKIQCLGNKNLPCYKLMFLCICLELIQWSNASLLLDACPPWLRAPMVPLHMAGGEATGLASGLCYLSDKMFNSVAKLCQACHSSVPDSDEQFLVC